MQPIRDALMGTLPAWLQPSFQPVVWRLLATGVIARGASGSETELYDRSVDMERVLSELFEVLGFPFHHDPTAQTVRLYAPGASIPGVPTHDCPTYPRLTTNVSADLAAGLIALWLLYREAIERNLLNDRGERVVELADLDNCMVSQLQNLSLQRQTDRRAMLTSFRQLRVVRLPDSGVDMEAGEALAIQRGILSLIFDTAAEAALEQRGDKERESA
ncbi:DUF4194 domain-containing protein [Pseudoxanthomonas sp. PXM03]|uniref:DUF4194 domain-containing protein n=1 Tax=Pseudoxanthomonas sp. PXM03 TaxID=2769284 RepID=UPI001784DCC5|nr:DUF4194 domain-containing protein [Pseudoxanthomonas sp. PXM03]MBD9437323.1 DUF4194 domain-containing protein [Pseudoxanthomonas sp. PXM03]